MKRKSKPTPEQETEKDQLASRPEGDLPTTLDPAGPEARGSATDPKTKPPDGKHPSGADAEDDIEYTA